MMKRMLLATALVATMTLGAGAAQAQDVLAWWSFNNSHNSDQGDGLYTGGGGYYHTTISNPPFDDGVWTGPTDDKMTPVTDTFNGVTPALATTLDDSTPTVAEGGAYLDVANLVGDNNGNMSSNTWGSFSGTDDNRPGSGTFPGGSLAITGSANNGSYFDIVADLSNYTDIEVSWAQRGTSTGYNSRTVQWSTDGVNFNPIYADAGTLPSSWGVESVDFGTSLDNASNAIIRFTVDGATSSNGNNRFDNIVLEGTVGDPPPVIPVPAAAWMGLAGIGGVIVRRLRSKA